MNPLTMRRLRQIHQYVGLFFAPAILFFAFSGALQTFGLHENHGGGPYKPPAWIVAISSLHKDQELPRRHAPDADQALAADDHGGPPDHGPSDKADADHGPKHAPEKPNYASGPLKIFVAALAIGLIASTLLGVYIALTNRSARRGSLIALALGVAAPVVLIWISSM